MATQLQRWPAVALMAAAGMLIGACGGGDDEGGSADTTDGGSVEVSGKEFSFTPDTLTLEAGQPTTIVFENTGSIEHDITVSDAGFRLSVLPGQSGDKTLTIDEPGTYAMTCSVAGHEAAGMKGEITVS